ncbi:bifunctional diguanylate cyclase/phosphodiesterase [Ancylobacter sp. 6x-1]|uniref:Bifunctional diguanylate cyclase/phosphodiesterase n=1 Tax=Ancylobacter crimeensis TaxID=2579147 RepID=A0ABT0DCG9_9HYPH|nr:bifunctional diguanylate cyclase/phosphodiesterase [Ancylobacter crimeensis]MCK0197569.1 bifunctional diguanylate cyclase/phosphodiesterase [Ancylobacter crimeensis]
MARSSRPTDRMILAVALVIMATVVAMGAFSLVVAERIDSNARERWAGVVTDALARHGEDMRRDLAGFAHWDESVLRTAYFLDADWVHRNFGKWLYDTRRHDQSFIVMEDRVTYAAVGGELVRPDTPAFDAAAIMPVVRRMQQAFATQAANGPHQGGAAAQDTVFRSAYVSIEGKPALVGAIGITPDYGRVVSPNRDGPVAVTVQFLDRGFLDELVAELHLIRPMISMTPPDKNRQGVLVPFADPATPPAWLTWVAQKPGEKLLQALLPSLIGVALLLLGAAAVVLWYARRATADLAESEALALRLAYVDPLSGLPNRAGFVRRLTSRLPQVDEDHPLLVLFVDLDRFKDINDTLGHQLGDLLLAAVGHRLQEVAGPNGMAARFGGDEFVLMKPLDRRPDAQAEACREVQEALRQPFRVASHSIIVGGSIGAVIAPMDGNAAEELIRLADISVYRAKADGRGSVRLFEPAMEAEVRRRREVELELSAALENGEIRAYFQPQMGADGTTVVGCEALVRWLHPRRGLVSPGEFIPVAEHSGLITLLDMYVLREACRTARAWPGIKLGVNLSPADFLSHDLAERIAAILAETGFDPSRLEVEITENLLVGNQPEAISILARLRAMGMRIALDDFGSGYSSLGYIRRFRIDSLKIDRSFTQNIGQTDDAPAIIDCVVRLARALGVSVTAEGVETREQLRYLKSVGCHNMQGFLFGPPMPAADFEAFVRRQGSADDRIPHRTFAGA